MKLVSLRTHNILDYVIGVTLVLSPYLFAFSDVPAARNVFLVLGFGLIAYSAITKYRISLAKIIPLGVHMAMDVTAGLVLMAAPFVFGYQNLLTDFQMVMHFVFGLGAIALVAVTRSRTDEAARIRDRTEVTELRRVA